MKRQFKPLYSGKFTSIEDVLREFKITEQDLYDDNLEIIMAHYYRSFSGEASVLLYSYEDSEYYEVNGNHCSCYGLEGQWCLEKIGSFKFLKKYYEKMTNDSDGYGVSNMIKESGYSLEDIETYINKRTVELFEIFIGKIKRS